MHFDSFLFLLIFALLVGIDRNYNLDAKRRRLGLLFLSYAFYATWSPLYLPFLFGSTALDFYIARHMGRMQAPHARKALLIVSLSVNFSLLGYFKYATFIAESMGQFFGSPALPETGLATPFIPLGISFFTFQTVSYTIDIYKRRTDHAQTLGEFALYVSFFPQLVAGPIVRSSELIPQLRSVIRASMTQLHWGAALIVLGLFQKVVVADAILRPVAERLFEGDPGIGTMPDHWLGTIAFMGQLYHDFSGYSNMAIGMASCLGYQLPANFRFPFSATSLSEFWTRWHITLTQWFGSYVYRPLGGSRVGPLRTALNVVTVMTLAGLWHGAAWTFVLWGIVHGVALVIGRIGQKWIPGQRTDREYNGFERRIRALFTFLIVAQSCILFRAHDIAHSRAIAAVFYGFEDRVVRIFGLRDWCFVAITLGICLELSQRLREKDLQCWYFQKPSWLVILTLSVMIVLCILLIGQPKAYIYFQF